MNLDSRATRHTSVQRGVPAIKLSFWETTREPLSQRRARSKDSMNKNPQYQYNTQKWNDLLTEIQVQNSSTYLEISKKTKNPKNILEQKRFMQTYQKPSQRINKINIFQTYPILF